ncbi:hypothetical protein [Acaryochloris marina]|uniref:hypothetical protein n=1 Tax=Acaryochloris marina TaxID=155978 RepID=UPI0021C3B38E|nr:hypothetical protein [Acaryochloris marina]
MLTIALLMPFSIRKAYAHTIRDYYRRYPKAGYIGLTGASGSMETSGKWLAIMGQCRLSCLLI